MKEHRLVTYKPISHKIYASHDDLKDLTEVFLDKEHEYMHELFSLYFKEPKIVIFDDETECSHPTEPRLLIFKMEKINFKKVATLIDFKTGVEALVMWNCILGKV